MGLTGVIIRILFALAVIAASVFMGFERYQRDEAGAWPFEGVNKAREDLIQELDAEVPDEARLAALAEDLARRAPLDPLAYTAFLVISTDPADGEFKLDRIEALAGATIARNARNRTARLVKFELLALRGDWATALDEFSVLFALGFQRRELIGFLKTQFETPAARTEILAKLSDVDTAWDHAFLAGLDIDRLGLSTIMELYAPFPDLQARLVADLTRQHRYDEAFLVWNLMRTDGASGSSFPFDGGFAGLNAPVPFNWSLDKRHAEMLPEGGLYVSYSGTGGPRIASQLLPLTPGTYQLLVEQEGEIPATAGDLVWSVHCVGTNRSVLELSLAGLSGADRIEPVFTVPGGDCDYQVLSLSGKPGEYPSPIRITLNSVQIANAETAP